MNSSAVSTFSKVKDNFSTLFHKKPSDKISISTIYYFLIALAFVTCARTFNLFEGNIHKIDPSTVTITN